MICRRRRRHRLHELHASLPQDPRFCAAPLQPLSLSLSLSLSVCLSLRYRDMYTANEGGDPPPPAASIYEKAISITSMSKCYGIPGARIGAGGGGGAAHRASRRPASRPARQPACYVSAIAPAPPRPAPSPSPPPPPRYYCRSAWFPFSHSVTAYHHHHHHLDEMWRVRAALIIGERLSPHRGGGVWHVRRDGPPSYMMSIPTPTPSSQAGSRAAAHT
jgi:hypothetical protein